MTDQLKGFLFDLLHSLVTVRMDGRKSVDEIFRWAHFGCVQGQLRTAQVIGLITLDQQFLLSRLLESASDHAGEPFPDKGNAGPSISFFELWKRDREAVKQQAQDLANEKPEPVPAPAASERLPVQCVLVSPFHVLTRFLGEPAPRPDRAAFPRLHPSWAPVLRARQMVGRARQLRLSLGPTKVPCALLGGGGKPGKARALRAHSRAF